MTAETEKAARFDALAWLKHMADWHDNAAAEWDAHGHAHRSAMEEAKASEFKAASNAFERQSAEIARLEVEVSAYRNLSLYQTDRNWSSDDPNDTIELCVGCGMPGRGYHDGDETCPVAVIEALSALPGEKQS